MCPIIAVAILFLCGWELITTGFRWLPMPYFPSPAGVLRSLLDDKTLLFDSTWHSLVLLLSGYALGVIAGLMLLAWPSLSLLTLSFLAGLWLIMLGAMQLGLARDLRTRPTAVVA